MLYRINPRMWCDERIAPLLCRPVMDGVSAIFILGCLLVYWVNIWSSSILIHVLTAANIWLLMLIILSKFSPSLATEISDVVFQILVTPFILVSDHILLPNGHLVTRPARQVSEHAQYAKLPDWLKECIFAALLAEPSSRSGEWILCFLEGKLFSHCIKAILTAEQQHSVTLISRLHRILVRPVLASAFIFILLVPNYGDLCLVARLLTILYCLSAEESCKEIFTETAAKFCEDKLEGLERFVLYTGFTFMEIALVLLAMCSNLFVFHVLVIPAIFINIVVPLRLYIDRIWYSWREASRKLTRYPRATALQLKEHDDVCAICLMSMRNARMTPCNHLFHGKCLTRCLEEKEVCPFCNQGI